MVEPNEKPKLPRKEDLLSKQNTPSSSSSVDETLDLKRVKDEEAIAIAQNKKAEAEIKTRLLEKGFQSLDEAQKAINQQKSEADKIVKEAEQIKSEALKLKEKIDADNAKVIKNYEIVKKREETVNARLNEAIRLEQNFKTLEAKYQELIKQLQELKDYHKENIQPCIQFLKSVAKAIYSWMEILNTQTKYDFSPLYNYILKTTSELDNYLEIPEEIHNDVIPTVQEEKVSQDSVS